LQFARGNVLSLLVESPTYEVSELGQVPYLDAAGSMNPQDGKASVFVLNRDLNKARTVEINWQDKSPGQVLTSTTLTGNDLKAFNSFDAPKKVTPQSLDKPSTASGRTRFEVPARSYTVIQWAG
jgi:alpha-L-arabinofuranosidase